MKLKLFGEIMTLVQSTVRRIRKVSGDAQQEVQLLPQQDEPLSQGFGFVPGETPDDFHDRMFDLPPHIAMLHEMEFAARQLHT